MSSAGCPGLSKVMRLQATTACKSYTTSLQGDNLCLQSNLEKEGWRALSTRLNSQICVAGKRM